MSATPHRSAAGGAAGSTYGRGAPLPLRHCSVRSTYFHERFDDGAVAPWARRTARLALVVHHLGLALGGRPAASFARRLMLPPAAEFGVLMG
jgi:hypothetical protein